MPFDTTFYAAWFHAAAAVRLLDAHFVHFAGTLSFLIYFSDAES